MNINERQTSAARIIHFAHPREKNLTLLQEQLGLHPHDVEAIAGVATKSEVTTYGHYIHVTWQWPDLLYGVIDLHCIIDRQRLIIIGDLPKKPIRDYLDQLMVAPNERWQYTPAMLLADLLRSLITTTGYRLEKNIPIAKVNECRELSNNFLQLATSLRELTKLYRERGFNEVEMQTTLMLLSHKLMLYSERCAAAELIAATDKIPVYPRLTRVVGGYAVASLVIITMVFFTMMK